LRVASFSIPDAGCSMLDTGYRASVIDCFALKSSIG
jgi:hypothetical protein